MAFIPIDSEEIIREDDILLIDMDGTLIETDYANYLSYQKAIKEVLSVDIFYNSTKRFTRKILKDCFLSINKDTFNDIIRLKEKYYSYFLDKTYLNVTLINLLNRYQTNKKILVTKCSKERGIQTLKYHNLFSFFDDIVYATTDNKYNEVIGKYSLNPTDIVIFENDDSEIDDAIEVGILDYKIIKITNI